MIRRVWQWLQAIAERRNKRLRLEAWRLVGKLDAACGLNAPPHRECDCATCVAYAAGQREYVWND